MYKIEQVVSEKLKLSQNYLHPFAFLFSFLVFLFSSRPSSISPLTRFIIIFPMPFLPTFVSYGAQIISHIVIHYSDIVYHPVSFLVSLFVSLFIYVTPNGVFYSYFDAFATNISLLRSQKNCAIAPIARCIRLREVCSICGISDIRISLIVIRITCPPFGGSYILSLFSFLFSLFSSRFSSFISLKIILHPIVRLPLNPVCFGEVGEILYFSVVSN